MMKHKDGSMTHPQKYLDEDRNAMDLCKGLLALLDLCT